MEDFAETVMARPKLIMRSDPAERHRAVFGSVASVRLPIKSIRRQITRKRGELPS